MGSLKGQGTGMRFEDFARLHGLRVGSLIAGKWIAVPTEDHPRKRNGRYKYLGNVGWVQNWATMDRPEMWRSESDDYQAAPVRAMLQDAERERQRDAEKAAQKAAWIMHQCKPAPHPYLVNKGFPDEIGNLWEEKGLLVIPMRLGSRLIGAQLISDKGDKKFLQGQRTKGASFVMDAKGIPIFCEGFATALSVRAVMRAMKIRYSIHVCFSASNLENVARGIDGGFIVADNDANGIGERAARHCGKPYWLSDTPGEDFNDFHRRAGLFRAMSSLKRAIYGDASSGVRSGLQSAAPSLS
jgi:phage/plasmid primase-like uncharacterized protein